MLLVLAYLRINASMNGRIGTTLETIIKDIGCKPNNHKGKINEMILDQLKWLETHNYIFINSDTSKISQKLYFEIEINNDHNIYQMFGEDDKIIHPYVSLTDREYHKITTTKTKANKAILLRVFLNIKKRINFDATTPKICFPSQDLIARDCNTSKGYSINNAIDELIKMNILFRHTTGGYKDKNGKVQNGNDVYAVDPKELKNANQIMLDYYKNEKGIKIDSFICFKSHNT